MEYRALGASGLRVSTIGLGSWLTYGGGVDDATTAACVARAWDAGVNFYDTANVYAAGDAERSLGRVLSDYPRDAYVLATKVYFSMGEGPNDRGLGRKHIFEQCHHSLTRLGVDYVDLYQCHRYDSATPLDETCRAMNDLVTTGRVLYWGVSEWTADQIRDAVELCRAAGWVRPISNQPEYNVLQRRIERDVVPVTRELGLGNVVWSPLAQGILTGKYRPGEDPPVGSRATGPHAGFMGRYMDDAVLTAARAFAGVAEEVGCSPAQLALAWCLREPAVSSVIVGATRVEHVADNVGAAGVDLSADTLRAIDELAADLQVEGV